MGEPFRERLRDRAAGDRRGETEPEPYENQEGRAREPAPSHAPTLTRADSAIN